MDPSAERAARNRPSGENRGNVRPGALLPRAGARLFYALGLPLIGLFATAVLGPKRRSKGKVIAAAVICMLFAGTVFEFGCNTKSSSPGTPAGSYNITVTGTDSSGTLVSSYNFAALTVQ